MVSLSGYTASTEKRLPLQTENLRYVLRPAAAAAALVDDRRAAKNKKMIRFTSRPRSTPEPAPSDEPLPSEPNFDKPLKRRTPEGG